MQEKKKRLTIPSFYYICFIYVYSKEFGEQKVKFLCHLEYFDICFYVGKYSNSFFFWLYFHCFNDIGSHAILYKFQKYVVEQAVGDLFLVYSYFHLLKICFSMKGNILQYNLFWELNMSNISFRKNLKVSTFYKFLSIHFWICWFSGILFISNCKK